LPAPTGEDSANTEFLRASEDQNLFLKIGEAFAFVVPKFKRSKMDVRQIRCRSSVGDCDQLTKFGLSRMCFRTGGSILAWVLPR